MVNIMITLHGIIQVLVKQPTEHHDNDPPPHNFGDDDDDDDYHHDYDHDYSGGARSLFKG